MADRCMQVKCKVDSCVYWDEGNVCGADGIEVDNSMMNVGDAMMEIGELGKGADEAKNSDETCCTTFKPKNKA
jgi:hypothetical protein